MIKRIALLGLLLSSLCGLVASQIQSQKIVAWDIHKVLFTEQGKHGYQCEPVKNTFELVKELHAQGVKQVILSNISERSFCKLIHIYPDYFKYFDLSGSMTEAEGIFTRKPHTKYFKKFLMKNNTVLSKDIIFFDEPSSGLDPLSGRLLDDLILQLRDTLGATIVVVTMLS